MNGSSALFQSTSAKNKLLEIFEHFNVAILEDSDATMNDDAELIFEETTQDGGHLLIRVSRSIHPVYSLTLCKGDEMRRVGNYTNKGQLILAYVREVGGS